jgi:hypothetical protein
VVGNQPKFNDEEEEPTPFAAGSVHGGDRLMPSGQEIGKKIVYSQHPASALWNLSWAGRSIMARLED